MGELYGDLATTENPSWRQGRFPLPIRPFGFRAQEKGNPSEAQNVQKVSRPLSKGSAASSSNLNETADHSIRVLPVSKLCIRKRILRPYRSAAEVRSVLCQP